MGNSLLDGLCAGILLGDADFEKSDTARAGVAPTGIPPLARFFFLGGPPAQRP